MAAISNNAMAKAPPGFLSELRPPETLSQADRRLHELPEEDLEQVEAKGRISALRASNDWQCLKSARVISACLPIFIRQLTSQPDHQPPVKLIPRHHRTCLVGSRGAKSRRI